MSQQSFYVIPTIDAEGVHGQSPFENFALGRIGPGEDWGALRIARIFREFGISGTFFVDVYEHSLFGEETLADFCEQLVKLNQDVQLHTHPSWRDDPRDHAELRQLKREKSFMPQSLDFMAKLSLAQQVDVLGHGIACIEKWIGKRPVIHRSGGYSINQDTVSALGQVGIRYDSSMNVTHANSKLTWSNNKIVEKDGIVELPVTIARLKAGLPGMMLYNKLIKTDINALDACHLQQFCTLGRDNGLVFLNYFMHSYSLLDYSVTFDRISPGHHFENQLRTFLAWAIDQPWIKVCDCATFIEDMNQPGFNRGTSDYIPVIADTPLVLRKGVRKFTNQLRTPAT